jgi:hypothetical protein
MWSVRLERVIVTHQQMPAVRRVDGPATTIERFSSMAEPRPNATVVSKRRASVTFKVYGAILTPGSQALPYLPAQ